MKLFTSKQAGDMWCPTKAEHFPLAQQGCLGRKCMAWVEAERHMEREDHSGADGLMRKELTRRGDGAKIRREGPDGSMGFLILDARGYCGKYQPKLEDSP